jgi:hypothetical protein
MIRTAEISYEEYWVIRTIKDTGTEKKCVREVKQPMPVNEQDILDELLKCEENEFITVEHNFRRGAWKKSS